MCVCRASERERESDGGRQRQRQRQGEGDGETGRQVDWFQHSFAGLSRPEVALLQAVSSSDGL